MKWHATHIFKERGAPPRRVMLASSGELFTRDGWENSAPLTVFQGPDGGVYALVDVWDGNRKAIEGASLTPIENVTPGGSLTELRAKVTRLTTQTTVRVGGKMRRLVVTLLPGDVIELRPLGCRDAQARRLSLADEWSRGAKVKARGARKGR